jgi:hypothetical protein
VKTLEYKTWVHDFAPSRSDARLEQRMAELDARLERRLAELKVDLIRWMFAFWAPTALAVGALLLRR